MCESHKSVTTKWYRTRLLDVKEGECCDRKGRKTRIVEWPREPFSWNPSAHREVNEVTVVSVGKLMKLVWCQWES